MGNCAEMCARDKNYSREEQDAFAEQSYSRALNAQKEKLFSNEITAVEVPRRKGDPVVIAEDDEPARADFDKMKTLRPSFEKDGTVTAANASKINDGAAAVLMMSAAKAEELGLKPKVKIVAQASAAQEPEWFTTAPVKAIKTVLDKAGLDSSAIDLWEINEAFAPVAKAAIDDFNLNESIVNVNGGAIALGHPIGASGARILTTLIYAMENKKAKTGLATLCIGGGEASALIVEKV
jgi:acetyl-CoA C-acetyltransferase